jgi:hypothetical protein
LAVALRCETTYDCASVDVCRRGRSRFVEDERSTHREAEVGLACGPRRCGGRRPQGRGVCVGAWAGAVEDPTFDGRRLQLSRDRVVVGQVDSKSPSAVVTCGREASRASRRCLRAGPSAMIRSRRGWFASDVNGRRWHSGIGSDTYMCTSAVVWRRTGGTASSSSPSKSAAVCASTAASALCSVEGDGAKVRRQYSSFSSLSSAVVFRRRARVVRALGRGGAQRAVLRLRFRRRLASCTDARGGERVFGAPWLGGWPRLKPRCERSCRAVRGVCVGVFVSRVARSTTKPYRLKCIASLPCPRPSLARGLEVTVHRGDMRARGVES